MPRVLVAITGASGTIYGVRLVQRLVDADIAVDVVLSEPARKVLAIEHRLSAEPSSWWTESAPGPGPLALHGNEDIAAPPASGSTAPDAMIVAPCSMGTAARIATGVSSTLIERSADVMLKERRPLVIVPRESPLSTLHLRNLLTLSELGARIVPAMPAFYFHPETIEDLLEFMVDRAIQSADIDLPLRHTWRRRPRPEGTTTP